MGKGTIISGGDAGQYQVQINYFRETYAEKIAALDVKIDSLEQQIAKLEEENYV